MHTLCVCAGTHAAVEERKAKEAEGHAVAKSLHQGGNVDH